MNHSLRKAIRTAQSQLYFLKGAKDAYYYYSRKLLGKTHEREFKVLPFVPDDAPGVWVDIGANQGQSIESILMLKPHARICSFEANPLLVEKLKAKYSRYENVTIRPFGLGDRDEDRTLYVPAYRKFIYDGEASFDKESAGALFTSDSLFWFSPEKLELKEYTCHLRRLDDQQLEPLFVKIDVQGYEANVLRGGSETLRRYEPILMIEAFHGNAEVNRLLRDMGYAPYLFDETGFYPSEEVTIAVNSILMTPARARTVRMSTRAHGAAPQPASPAAPRSGERSGQV